MHLICPKHKRRVMVLDKKTIHRNDGTVCITDTVQIGDKTVTVKFLQDMR